MLDIYEFIEECKKEGLTSEEAIEELNRALYENKQAMIDSYYNDPIIHEGWIQEDIIDMYRRER